MFGRSVALCLLVVLAQPAIAAPFEADNGAKYEVVQVRRVDNQWRGGSAPYAMAEVIDEDGRGSMLVFDCAGSFSTAASSTWRRVPSRSVAAGIEKMACRALR